MLRQTWFDHGPDSLAWQEQLAAIEDLLWSLKPKTDPAERQTLSRRLPQMLKTLKAGMEGAGVPTEVQDRFLDDCFTLQTQALRGVAPATAAPALLDELRAIGLRATDNPPRLGSIESDGRKLTTLDFAEYQPAPSRAMPYAVGDWLRFCLDGDVPVLGRVCHISPASQRVLLCNPDAALCAAVHPAILARQLRDGQAGVASGHGLFETAAARALSRTPAA